MRIRHALLVAVLLNGIGCSSSVEETAKVAPTSANENASSPVATQDIETKVSETKAGETKASETATPPKAEVSAADMAELAEPTNLAEPTTALAALKVIDLEDFPKPPVKQLLDSQPMSLYYSTEGSISSVDEFNLKELGKAGWTETKHLVTSTDQYVDRLLTKEGYYLRITISTGSSSTEISVNLNVLGNFDVRTLPQTKDAQPLDSTPVMAGHLSALPIAEACEDLTKRMTEAGWQVVQDYQPALPDVPHYRSVHFRKNAVRVNMGLVKDPVKPADKTNIFYHAEGVIPIDLPMIDHHQAIKFDSTKNRASIPWKGSRASMVELYKQQSPEFGWQMLNVDDYLAEKTPVLYISVGTPIGTAAALVESAGDYYLTLQRVRLPGDKQPQTTGDNSPKTADTDEASQ